MRVAVIGAGILGAHVAVALARRGAEVTLLERGRPGEGSTAGSFAWIDASHPGVAPYLELRVLGLRAWRRRREELGNPNWLSLPGTLSWPGPGDDGARLDEHVKRLADHGCRAERLTRRMASRLEPGLLLPAEVETVYSFEGEGWVRAMPALAALIDEGRAAGMRVRVGSEVTGLRAEGRPGRVTGVRLASGEDLPADAVVSCAGRWTEALLSPAGVAVPMLGTGDRNARVAGLIVRTTPVSCQLGRVVHGGGLLVRPDGGGLLLHSDELDAGLDGEIAGSGAVDALLALLRARLRGAEEAGAQDAWVCLRALPADLLPVAGWAIEGLYVVATHSGVTLAPALGPLVAREIVDDADAPELARFRPGRFDGSET